MSILVVLLATVGCGSGGVELPPTAPVSGTVKLDGEALEGALVSFIPTSKTGVFASGTTDGDGNYELMTVGSKPVKGVVPGDYKVRISLMTTADGKPYDPTDRAAIPGRESLKPQYSDESNLILKATVKEDGGEENFDLKSK